MANIGDRVAKQYRLDKEIEKQASVSVFMATDVNDASPVFVRIIRDLSQNQSQELLKTAETLVELNHPHLETPIASGFLSPGEVYLVTPSSPALYLNEIVPKDEGLSLEDSWPIIAELAKALSAAHARGLFHTQLDARAVRIVRDSDENESVLICGTWSTQPTSDVDDLSKLVALILYGKKAPLSLLGDKSFDSVEALFDALSEVHRAKITIMGPEDKKDPAYKFADFSIKRFLLASFILSSMGVALLLYFWLASS